MDCQMSGWVMIVEFEVLQPSISFFACRLACVGVVLCNSNIWVLLFTDYDPIMAATKTTKGKAPAKSESPLSTSHPIT